MPKHLFADYYDAHQVTKSINIIDIVVNDHAPDSIIFAGCVCEVLEPMEGWGRNVDNAGTPMDKCYFCKQRMKELYKGFVPSKALACGECYKLLAGDYVSVYGKTKLTAKFVRKNRRKME